MSDDASDPARPAADSVDARQVGLVALALVAVVTAAFLVPAVAAPGGDEPGEREPTQPPERTDGNGGGDGGGGFGWLQWLMWLLPTRPDPTPPSDPECRIALSPPPSPGEAVTVSVTRDGSPLADAPVWLEDRHVGRTNDDGRVTGEVPYVRELSVRVGLGGESDCRAVAEGVGSGSVGRSSFPAGDVSGSAPSTLPVAVRAVGIAAAASNNATVSYAVDGTMRVDVRGDPYPGETLSLRATIDGRPVPNATVTVDGDPVGRTDRDGNATVPVPDDGSSELTVRVERGEFAAGTTVDVLLLEAALAPSGLAVVPGADATAVARFADVAADGAAVTVAGERRGTTGPDGNLAVVLPADPTATVRVEARSQSATTSVLEYYRLPAALVGLLVAAVAGVTAWRRGPRAAAGVLVGAGTLLGALAAVAVVDAFYGATARNGLLAALCAVVVAVGLYARRDGVIDGVRGARSSLARLFARVRSAVDALRERSVRVLLARLRERALGLAVGVAAALGTFVDALAGYAGELLAAVRSLPRSWSALFGGVLERLRSLPDRLADAIRGSPLALAGIVAAATAVGLGYRVGGRGGAVLAAVAVGLAAVVVRYLHDENGDETVTSSEGETDGPAKPSVVERTAEHSFRELWRAFARLVVPGEWRTRTPAEVARAAVERGYPRRPVEELTTLFREVEYGGRTLSGAVRERAAAAYDDLRTRRGEEP